MNALVALAFGAGMLAPVNPCGFALLPAYLSTFLQPDTASDPSQPPMPLRSRLRIALINAAAMTAGFVLVVTAIGAALAGGLRQVIHLMPWLAALVGFALVLGGAVMLSGVRIPVRVPGIRAARAPAGSVWRLVTFGAGYALASASCTMAILLAVVTQAVTADTVPGIITVFAANAAGSALVLFALAVAAALAHTALSSALGRAARYLPRVSGALLAASGAYLLIYWLPHLDGSTPTQRSGLDRISATATTWISGHQTPVALTALVIIAAAVPAAASRRRTRQPDDCCTTEADCTDQPAPATADTAPARHHTP